MKIGTMPQVTIVLCISMAPQCIFIAKLLFNELYDPAGYMLNSVILRASTH